MDKYLFTLSMLRDLIASDLHTIYEEVVLDDHFVFEFSRRICCVFELVGDEDFDISSLLLATDAFYRRDRSDGASDSEIK